MSGVPADAPAPEHPHPEPVDEKQRLHEAETANGQPQAPGEEPSKEEPSKEEPSKEEPSKREPSKNKPNGPDAQEDQSSDSGSSSGSDGPDGGYNDTPIPSPPPGTVGYTVKFTLHRATNLPIGDIGALSSDPYVLAQLNTDVSTRHKQDPYLRHRTHTVRKSTEPEWNDSWIVANVPSSGFKLKLRIYDEDPADHDDLLGKLHLTVPSLSESWSGIKNEPHKISLRQGSKRALIVRTFAKCIHAVEHVQGDIYISVEMLGRTGDDGQNGRVYTVGDCRWIRHFSPVLGRMLNIKEPGRNSQTQTTDSQREREQYNFQANQMQLQGPVPTQLYHRFVEFQPWVKRMFTTSGFQGVLLGKALHHQHNRVYNFGRSTIHGSFPQGPCTDMTKQFLDLVHYDEGGRIFTYVLTLDALWRFTETGKEFGIDMLSKHTMHSDVSIYIAFSGEFFIRRLKHRNRPPPPEPAEGSSQSHPPEHKPNDEHPPDDVDDRPSEEGPSRDPSHYELVIDNDSGTYRPNAAMLPLLASFLSRQLPGLHILTLDCQADAKKQQRMKEEQRRQKQREGNQVVYAQASSSSSTTSLSSSDDERLEGVQAQMRADAGAADAAATGKANNDNTTNDKNRDVAAGDGNAREHGAARAAARDAKANAASRVEKFKRVYGGVGREGASDAAPAQKSRA